MFLLFLFVPRFYKIKRWNEPNTLFKRPIYKSLLLVDQINRMKLATKPIPTNLISHRFKHTPKPPLQRPLTQNSPFHNHFLYPTFYKKFFPIYYYYYYSGGGEVNVDGQYVCHVVVVLKVCFLDVVNNRFSNKRQTE